MKSLRPFQAMFLAAALGGTAVAIVVAVVQPDTRTDRGMAILFGCGAAVGIFAVAPIVAGEFFNRHALRILGRHAYRVNWYVSLLMAAAMGYLFASVHHGAFDNLAMAAAGTVLLGALTKTFLFTAYGPRGRTAA